MKPILRAIVAGLLAMIVGLLVSMSGFSGARFATQDFDSRWDVFLWSNHWALRCLASTFAFSAAGFVAGLCARRHGALIALISSIPAVALWSLLSWPSTGRNGYLSIGYRFVSAVLIVVGPYVAIKSSRFGEQVAADLGSHFDERPRFSFFGIRWFHYGWIPIYFYILLSLHWPILVAFLNSVRGALRSGPSIFSLVPFFIAMGLGSCFQLSLTGLGRTYNRLAAIDDDKTSIARNLFLGPAVAVGVNALLLGLSLLLAKLGAA